MADARLTIRGQRIERAADNVHYHQVERGHGAFAWGADWKEAIERAAALEVVAEMALKTLLLSPDAEELPEALLRKHFDRKHGDSAYYGQRD